MSSFPQDKLSTVSHWQATNRGKDALWDHGRDAPIPTSADIVIIGGGICGCSLAYQLTRPGGAGEGKRVILLEAKDVASGASGRNGGHIAPASPSVFPTLVAPLKEGGSGLSAKQALHVLDNEADTLAYASELAEKEGIAKEIDLWTGEKLEVKVTQPGVEAMTTAFARYGEARKSCPRTSNSLPEWELIPDAKVAKEISRMPSAIIAAKGPAGSCHPHKFTTALAKLAIASTCSDFQLFSWAPVAGIEKDGDGVWKVDVGSRGSIRSKTVVLCTNAHTRHLFADKVKGVPGHITPFRGHAALVTTPPTYSGNNQLQQTYAIENGPYLMTTPSSGIVLGVYNVTALSQGIATRKEIYEVTDDSIILPKFKEWMGEYCPKKYQGWGKQAPGEGLVRAWSGIMGASRDQLPLVGAVPNEKGLYAAVAFHGHGMARILTTTRGLAHLLKTGEWDDRLPSSFAITDERLNAAREQVPDVVTDVDRQEVNELNDAMEVRLNL